MILLNVIVLSALHYVHINIQIIIIIITSSNADIFHKFSKKRKLTILFHLVLNKELTNYHIMQ